jgi:F420-0:gamma-glutamyl ligase
VDDQDLVVVERAVWFTDASTCEITTSDPSPLALVSDVKYEGARVALAVVVTNNQAKNINSNTGLDDAEIELETYDATLSFSAGAVAVSSLEGVTLPNNSIGGESSDIVLIQLPPEVTESLRATMSNLPATAYETLDVEIVLHGKRTNQVGNGKLGTVKTRPFTYPIEICAGCLEECYPTEDCGGTCPTTTEWRGICGFAQGADIVHPTCYEE